jgi:hypothetical protein
MEVNISATTRTSVTSAVEALEAEVPSTVTGTNPMKGYELLARVYLEVHGFTQGLCICRRSSVHLTRSAQVGEVL